MGFFEDADEAVKRTIEIEGKISPISENVDRYNRNYEIYRELYPALKSSFRKVSV